MSLLHSASSIPTESRCATCGGDGDEWAQVGDQYEAVAECRDCKGTGCAAPHVHRFAESFETDLGHHYYRCSCGSTSR